MSRIDPFPAQPPDGMVTIAKPAKDWELLAATLHDGGTILRVLSPSRVAQDLGNSLRGWAEEFREAAEMVKKP